MMKRTALLFLLLAPLVAHAEPVTLTVAAIAAWAGTTATVVYLVAATVIVSAGMAVYGSAQARRAERDAKNQAAAAMRDRMATRIATESPHRYIYGRSKVGVNIVAMFTSGARDEFKHLVCVVAAHECDAIEQIFVNNVAIGTLAANGDVTTGRYAKTPFRETAEETWTGPTFTLNHTPIPGSIQVYSGSGAAMSSVGITGISDRTVTVSTSGPVIATYQYGNAGAFGDLVGAVLPLDTITPTVRAQIHLGVDNDPADPYLMSVVPSSWPASAVLRGLCYIVVSLDLNTPEFQGGQVPIHVLVRGKKLYDPRTGLTQWSQNPALAIYDYLTGPICGIQSSDLPLAQYITAANVCDEILPGGWFMPRYTINGDVTSDQDQSGVLETLAQCMAGSIVATTWDIYAGTYTAPVAALVQSDIVGSISITPGASDAAIYNGVKGQYISDDNKYILTDFKPYQNAAYRVSDGRDLYTNIDFPFTDSLQRVTNLARIFTEDMRNGYTIKAEFSLKAWPRKVGERITFTGEFFGQSAKIFRITDKRYAPNSSIELTLKEDDPTIWDFADAVVVDSTPNSSLPDPWAIAELGSLTCTVGDATLLRQDDGTMVPRILVTWPAATTQAVFTNGQIEVEWRAVSTTAWSKVIVSGSDTQTHLSPITPGYFYLVRARCVNPYLNTKSNWVNTYCQVSVFSARPIAYKWSDAMPATPTGASLYAWATRTYGAAPAGWSATIPVKPTTGPDVSLWAAEVLVKDVSASGSTTFDWSTSTISAVGYAAASAAASAADALSKANAALNNDLIIASDNWLSMGEKPNEILKWQASVDERPGLISSAANLGVDSTYYTNAYDALSAYLPAGWNDTSVDTAIVGVTYRSKWADYYAAKLNLMNAIAAKAATMASGMVIGGRNLYPDSGFERGTHPCTSRFATSTVEIDSVGGGGIAPYAGTKFLWFSSATGAGLDMFLFIGGGLCQVVAGRQYQYSFMYATATNGSIVDDTGGCFLRLSDGSQVPVPLPATNTYTNWTLCEFDWVCPAGITTVEARYGIHCDSFSWMAVDCIQMEEGNTRTQWMPAPEDMLADMPGAVTTTHMINNAATDVIAATAANVAVTYFSATETIITSISYTAPATGNTTDVVTLTLNGEVANTFHSVGGGGGPYVMYGTGIRIYQSVTDAISQSIRVPADDASSGATVTAPFATSGVFTVTPGTTYVFSARIYNQYNGSDTVVNTAALRMEAIKK